MRNIFFFMVSLAVLGLAGFGIWKLVPHGESVPDLGPFMQPLLEATVAEAVEAIPRAKTPNALFVLPVRGDVRDLVRKEIVSAVSERGIARIIDQASLGEKLGGEGILGGILKEVLGADPKIPVDIKKAEEFLKRCSLPGLLWAEARIVETDEEGRVELRVRILNATGEEVFDRKVVKTYGKGFFSWPYLRSRILGVSLAWRLLGWLVFVLLLPIVGSPIITKRLKRESNVTNAITLFFLTALSAVALWFLLGFSTGFWSACAVGVLGIGVAGVYHYLVADFLEDLRR